MEQLTDTLPTHGPRYLFFALLAFIAFAPLDTGGSLQRFLYLAVTLAMLVAAIRLSWLQPRGRAIVIALSVPAAIAAAADAANIRSEMVPILMVFSVALFVYLTVRVLRKIVRDLHVSAGTLYGAACIYLLIGIIWALLYSLLSRMQPNALFYAEPMRPADVVAAWPAYVYFSFTTLATVGFGDITPGTEITRSIAILEIISGVFYVAVLVGRLVDLYRPRS
jgi:Ion channel